MNIDKIVELAQSSHSMMSRRIVKSAMTPIVLVCLVSPCFLVAAYSLKDDTFLSRFFGIVGATPIFVACGVYVYLALFKTDKLQSEDYQIRQELLQMIAQKGGKIKIEPVSIGVITPPDGKAIEGGEEGKK